MKKCTRCNKELNSSQFSKNMSISDGLSTVCRTCLKEERLALLKTRVYDTYSERDTKVCTQCNVEQPILTNFYKNKYTKSGYHGVCKSCRNKEIKECFKKRQEKDPLLGSKIYNRCYYPGHWASISLSNHRSRGYTTEITTQELTKLAENTPNCPVCGNPLGWKQGKGKTTPLTSPTLENLNNEKIIRLDGVQIWCHKCNTTKASRTFKEFVEYCELITSREELLEKEPDIKLDQTKEFLLTKKDRRIYAKWSQYSRKQHRLNGYKILFSHRDLLALAIDSPSCHICGRKVDWAGGRKKIHKDSPSLDNRNIKQELGILDVDIVCYECNSTKQDRTLKDFLSYCRKIAERFGTKTKPKEPNYLRNLPVFEYGAGI